MGRRYRRKSAIGYPIEGLVYLMTSPTMWKVVICVVLLGLFVAITTILILFVATLQRQARLFGGGDKWWCWVLAVVAVLFESMLLSGLILVVFYSKCQKQIFVETMRLEGQWREGIMVEPSVMKDVNCCRIGFFIKMITFPLNLIPVAGTILFSFINAPFAAWDLMDMYFDAIQMDSSAQMIEVSGGNLDRSCCAMYASSDYVRFGFVSMLLETIPIFGPALFALSNACGAALWACNMEKMGGPPTLSKPDGKSSFFEIQSPKISAVSYAMA